MNNIISLDFLYVCLCLFSKIHTGINGNLMNRAIALAFIVSNADVNVSEAILPV